MMFTSNNVKDGLGEQVEDGAFGMTGTIDSWHGKRVESKSEPGTPTPILGMEGSPCSHLSHLTKLIFR